MNRHIHHKIFTYAAWLTLFIGVILRGAVWLQQRSIFLDEANLMRNFVEKSYAGLFGHLDYQQYAPPLFSVVMKFILYVFGVNELSAKLFPLLCGVAILFVFYNLARRFLSPFTALLALLFLVFDKIFIDYATECKQYATDAFIAVLLLLLTQMIDFKSFNKKGAVLWSIIGSIAMGFSMPAIFVLASVGAYYFFLFYRNKDTQAAVLFALVSLFWLVQFGIYFLLVLKTDAQSNNLQTFHKDFFLAFPPLSIVQLNLLINQIGGIIDRSIGITFLAAFVSAVSFIAGAKTLWQTNKAHFLLLVLPILLTLAASSLHYYSLIARLILFFLPIFILIVFIGLDHIIQKMPLAVSGILTIGFIATIVLQIQILNPFEPFRNDYAELRDGLDFIKKEKQPDEAVFIHHGIAPVVRYYTQFRDNPYQFNKLVLQEYVCCDPNIIELGIKTIHQQGIKRIWILHDQPDYSAFLALIKKQNGQILKKREFHRGVVLLYEAMQ